MMERFWTAIIAFGFLTERGENIDELPREIIEKEL